MEDYGIQITREEMDNIDRICEKIRNRMTKERMTPRQRFEAIWRGEQPDRLPIVVEAIGLHVAAYYGIKPADLYVDPKISLMAYLTHLERFGYDTVGPFRFSAGEKEFGGTISIAEGAIPTLVKGAVETGADIDNLKLPDVRKDGTLPWLLWMIRILKEKLGDIMPVFGFMPIPGAINPVITPMEKLFTIIRRKPALGHALAALLTKFCIEYAAAQFEAGADVVRIVGTDDQVSYKDHREFEFPYVCALTRAVNGPFYIIGAADWSHVLESYAQAGVQGFDLYSGQPLNKAKEVAVKYGLVLHYGVSSHTILHGPPERIREEVRQVIKEGAPGCRFVVSTEPVDFSTPAEHVDAFVEAAREYGQLPLSLA